MLYPTSEIKPRPNAVYVPKRSEVIKNKIKRKRNKK